MGRRMSPGDAVWFLGENRVNPMTISSIMWFDRPIDVELLRARFQERLLDRHPIMRERIVPSRVPGVMPRWVEDRSFDLGRHISEDVLPAPGDQATLQHWCSEERTIPLDRSRPLWHVSVLQGYRGGGSAIHTRIHHSIGDGLAMLSLLLTIVDEYDPEVIVGSSRGGAVALAIRSDRPLILLAPAWRFFGVRPRQDAAGVVIHSGRDRLVPVGHSRGLCRRCPGLRLVEAGCDHRLNCPASRKALAEAFDGLI